MSNSCTHFVALWMQNGPHAWASPEEFGALTLKSAADLPDTTRSSARRRLKEAGVVPIWPDREVLPCRT